MSKHTKWLILAALCLGTVLGYLASKIQTEVVPVQAAQQQVKPDRKESPTKKPVGSGVKPNIVFIMADNLGYGEPGCYGGGILRGAATPRIDKLATQGIRLLNYSVESQ